ncbi:MAG: hypothetical protein KBF45_04200 [Cyclobacteriaceae bacterium]|nr:hypothetical protein [Cyclobacteriaceae bacterium]
MDVLKNRRRTKSDRFYDSKWQQKYLPDKFEYGIQCKTQDAEWQQYEPNNWKQEEHSDGQRPADYKQNTPQNNSHKCSHKKDV